MRILLTLILLVSLRGTDGKRNHQKPILHTASNNTASTETLFSVELFESRATVDLRSNSSIMEPSNTSSTATSKTAFPSRSITKTIKLGFHFFLWYFFTVVYNVSNKRVLNDLPLPATVAVIQIILGIPVFLPVWLFKRPNFESCRAIIPSICKIGFVHALGNLATVISLSQGSVSFTHIIKAAEPIFSAALSAIIYGDFATTSVYITLIPIVVGVAISSVKELSFTWTGFLAGMASNLFYQLRIVLSKKEFTGDAKAVSPSNFFRLLTIVSALELLPISIALEGYKVRSAWEAAVTAGVNTDALMSNLLISGFSYYCYNEVSFWILGSISPMTHAVGNTVKRVAIILASILILKSPISDYGIMGSTMAVLGTFAYAMASHHSTQKVIK